MERISPEFQTFLIDKAFALVHKDPCASAELRQFFIEKENVEKLVKDCQFEAPPKSFEVIRSQNPPSLNDWHTFSDDWHADRNVWVVYAVILVKTYECALIFEKRWKILMSVSVARPSRRSMDCISAPVPILVEDTIESVPIFDRLKPIS